MNQTNSAQEEGLRLLAARLDDLCDRAARGEVAVSPFLTPREAKYVTRHLVGRMSAGMALLYGGYPAAERVRAIMLPDYMEGMLDPATLAADPVAMLREAGFEDLSVTLCDCALPLCIKGSGFRELGHRDYLGSVLGLGLERDAIGDIVVTGPCEACLITGKPMGEFLISHLEKVATDAVRAAWAGDGCDLGAARRLQPISDTVASERLDCVVAALCQFSREKAQTAIRSGLVELDYEPVDACDRAVEPPAVISVRGVGKFAVHGFDGMTRRGRIRMTAGKYV